MISSVNPHDGVQIPRSRLSAGGWGGGGDGHQSSEVQPEGSAAQVIAPGIRMLHPGLGPAVSPGNLPFLESTTPVPAVQGAVPRSQSTIPSIIPRIKLRDPVVSQALCEGKSSCVAAAKAAPIVVRNEAKHEPKRESKHEASNYDADVSSDTKLQQHGPLSSAGQEKAEAARFVIDKLNLLSSSICLEQQAAAACAALLKQLLFIGCRVSYSTCYACRHANHDMMQRKR